MPELPEMEAWRRQLNAPVSTFPIASAGPAHIATLKTFDPPLDALESRRFRGAERRGKRLLFPTDDGELVLLVHLMTAARLKLLRTGEKGPKKPAFAIEFQGGSKLVLTENARKKRAGVWLLTPEAAEAELAPLGPEALGLGPERLGEIVHGESRRLHALLRNQHVIAGIGRAWANELLHAAKPSTCARREPPTRRPTASTGGSASRATSAARRSRRSTSRSTRSTTARPARPAAASSRIDGSRAYSGSGTRRAFRAETSPGGQCGREAGCADDDRRAEGDPEVDRQHDPEAAVVARVEVDPELHDEVGDDHQPDDGERGEDRAGKQVPPRDLLVRQQPGGEIEEERQESDPADSEQCLDDRGAGVELVQLQQQD